MILRQYARRLRCWYPYGVVPIATASVRQTSRAWRGYAAAMSTRVITDKSGKGGQATLAWVLTACTLGYLLPWAVAATRGKSNTGSILLINVLLGWSVIGWIVALVMACSSHQAVGVRP